MPAPIPFPTQPDQKWFTVRAEGSAKGVIDVRGTIGLEKFWEEEYGIDASGTVTEFERAVKDLGEVREIELNIYSEGGEVFAALAMHAILTRHPARVVANIDGLAASSATILMLAADEIRMPENAYVMIHNPSWGGWGDHREISAIAEQLRKWGRDMANLYAGRIEDNTGGDRAAILSDVIAKMDATTWLTGAEAKALGLVEVITGRVDLAANAAQMISPMMLQHLSKASVPEPLKALLFDRPAPGMSTTAAPIIPAPTAEATTAAPVAPVEISEPTATAETIAPVEAVVSDQSDTSDTSHLSEGVEVPAAPVAPVATEPTASLTLDAIRGVVAEAVTAATTPLTERLAAAEAALAHEQGLRASGVPQNAWGNQRPAEIPTGDAPSHADFATMSAGEKIRLGREKMHPAKG
jgi:ATP-dependent protease ClpP protease subunit